MIVGFRDWFWPALSFLLAVLWLWTLLSQRRRAPASPAQARELRSGSAELEDLLRAGYALGETGEAWDGARVARSVGLPEARAGEMAGQLVDFGWAEEDAQGNIHLTETGQARARELTRAHRLWERYLVDREQMALEAVHAEADRREHQLTAEELDELDAGLGHPAWDPHGHAIPSAGREAPASVARSLAEEGSPGSRLRVVYLDDEPAALLAQLVALGFRPGVDVEILECEHDLMRLRLDGWVIPLAAAAARHVFVVAAPTLPVPLGELPVGSRAQVVEALGSGKHERRMLDMGFVPGAEVTVMRKAPLGDPIEYRIKGTAVALRKNDANTVLVEELQDD